MFAFGEQSREPNEKLEIDMSVAFLATGARTEKICGFKYGKNENKK